MVLYTVEVDLTLNSSFHILLDCPLLKIHSLISFLQIHMYTDQYIQVCIMHGHVQVYMYSTAHAELKRSIVKAHVECSKHKRSKEGIGQKEKREQDIAKALVEYEKAVHPAGESLHEAQKIYRIQVVKTFLKSGVPLEHFVSYLKSMLTSYQIKEACATLFPLYMQKK